MPIYEYECQKCGHHLEALQKISDKPLRECPECGKHSLKRLMSAPLFRLAGSGWYETDFKSDNESKRNLVEKGEPEPAKTESKPDVKSDAKTEAKTDAKPAPTAEPKARTTVTSKALRPGVRGKPKVSARKVKPASGKKR